MKKYFYFIFLLAFLGAACTQTEEPILLEPSLTTHTMNLSSNAFTNNGTVPVAYTCDGQNVNPPLQISGTPETAKSLVLIVDDPDAPRGTWVHWTVWNIDPKTTEIPANSVPAGSVQGLTDFGNNKWGGPCPPSGTHRYFFKIYALDVTLDLPVSAKKIDLESAMQGHVLDKAELIGLFQRQK